MTNKKHITGREASVETLRTFFSAAVDSDVVAVEDVFAVAGRADRGDTQNRSWLSNKLTSLYYHNLVTAIKDSDGRLEQLKLTTEGKKALNQKSISSGAPNQDDPARSKVLTIEQIMDAIPQIRKAHPGWDIVFTVNPKLEAPMSDQ